MFKTTLSVTLLIAAQNALEIQPVPIGEARQPRLSKEELKELVQGTLDAGLYQIDNQSEECHWRPVRKALRNYFNGSHNCAYKFDEDGIKPNEKKLEKCLDNK